MIRDVIAFFTLVLPTILYFTLQESSARQATWGKRKIGIRVVNATVLVDAGNGDYSLGWSQVQPEVARFSRICTYDRAGYGWSDPHPVPRTAKQMALELHTLLGQANIEGPYVLVGNSLGRLNVRMYASLHPEEVVGMVLVDAMQEDILTQLPPERSQIEQQHTATWGVMKFMAQFGVLRMMGKSAGEQFLPAHIKRLPADKQELYVTLMSHPAYFETAQGELQLLGESCKQVREVGKLGDLPLVVLTAKNSQDIELSRAMPAPAFEQTRIAWQSSQDELAKLSTNGTHLIAKGSGHVIHLDRPDLVITAIQQVIDQSRARTPLVGVRYSSQ